MQRIEIWLCEENDGRDPRLTALLRALREAGVQAHVMILPAENRDMPVNPLLWHGADDSLRRARDLGLGATDVVGPWMETPEALARCLRHLRIIAGIGRDAGTQLRLGELEIDLIEREARRQGRTLGLLQREFELLNFLAARPDHPHSREALLRAIWQLGFDPGTNVVEVHVSRLRAKLDRGFDWPMLRTVRGAGYALVSHTAG